MKKKQRYTPTHDTSTHVFKQLNQIIRVFLKKVELESIFPMNCLLRKWSQVQHDRKNAMTIDASELTIHVLY